MISVPIEPYDSTHSVIHVTLMYDDMHKGIILLMQLSSAVDNQEELAKVDGICGASLFLPHIDHKNLPLIEECERAAKLEIEAKFGTAWTAVVHFAAKHQLKLL